MTDAKSLRIEDYFLGRTRAQGLVEGRFGNVRRKFSVVIDGHAEDDIFVLDEKFQFDDGERTTRIWRVKTSAEGRYEGRADDVVGVARGRAEGMQLSWAYSLRLPIGKRTWIIDFDDRMFLRDDGVLLNIAEMRKWGLAIGRLTIAFRQSAD